MMRCLNVKLIVNIILNVFDGIHDNFSLALESPTSNALGNFKFPIDDYENKEKPNPIQSNNLSRVFNAPRLG